MNQRIQCCVRCGNLEYGQTGYADRYLCTDCHKAGWRVDAGGNIDKRRFPEWRSPEGTERAP